MDSMTPDLWMSDPDNHLKMLHENWYSLPELTLLSNHSIREGQIVRFRGMIQDMADPVIYLSKFEVRNELTGSVETRCGKYRDVISINDNETVIEGSADYENGDRRSYHCISLPGLNCWTRKEHASSQPENHMGERKKRSADDSDEEMNIASSDSSNTKRRETVEEMPLESGSPWNVKNNFPIDSANNYCCIVNVYDELDSSDGDLHLNEEVEFAGFINFAPGVVGDGLTDLPSTLVPRLHAVSWRRGISLGPLHDRLASSVQDEVLTRVDKVRSDLHMVLTILLLGDSLAAEYLLCNLISRIYRRQDTVVLGKLSVNISNVPVEEDYPFKVYEYLTKLVPKSHYLSMDLLTLNTSSFLPKKDYENNRLASGTLQLSDHTHLFLDETKLGEGKLVERGLLNLKALENLITYQKLDCDFMYSRVEYPVDIPVIVMSEGKSILMCDVRIPLCPDDAGGRTMSERLPTEEGYPTGDALDDIRAYLAASSSKREFTIPDDMMQIIQDEYVKMRQVENKTSEFDLHNLLVLSRLLSLSHGKEVLSREFWDHAVLMEVERKTRERNIPTTSSARVL